MTIFTAPPITKPTRRFTLWALFLLLSISAHAQDSPPRPAKSPINVLTNVFNSLPLARPKPGVLTEEEISGFAEFPPATQKLLRAALALSRQKLNYKMGSADPSKGGMDCSGTIYYLLQQAGVKNVPRSSYDQYVWVRDAKTFHAEEGAEVNLKALRPGNLLFWTGTYATRGRSPAVSHVMIYLGTRKSDGKPVMIGASDGRHYDGKARWGVGVFDFTEPPAKSKSRFIGYAGIPGL